MFARTFAVHAKALDLGNARAVADFIESKLIKEVVGRKPFKFRFFVDTDPEAKKIVFYDMSANENVIEFSGLFGRLPQYNVECDLKTIKIHHFNEDNALARVLSLHWANERSPVTAVSPMEEETKKENESLRAVASATSGFLDTALDLDGIVNCSAVESVDPEEFDSQGRPRAMNKLPPEEIAPKERLPFFVVKLDAKSGPNRGIIRSCEGMNFAWSEERSYMILMCRFKMLPPFALVFPITGKVVQESMELYMEKKKAVGMVMYSDDVSDAFRIEKGKPTFE